MLCALFALAHDARQRRPQKVLAMLDARLLLRVLRCACVCALWRLRRVRAHVAGSVPDSLRDALGGEEALQKVLDSVPSKLPLKGWCAVDVQDTAEVARAHNRAGACEGAPETTPMVV
jgi:hypothetical protein